MKKLKKAVATYNATYGTNFKVSNPYSLKAYDHCDVINLDKWMSQGGLYLIYDCELKLLIAYASNNIGYGIGQHFELGASGNWISSQKWYSEPQYIVCICGDQDKLYEKDSLKSFLIKNLYPLYDAQGKLQN